VLVQLLERLADNGLLAAEITKNSIRQKTTEILSFLKGTQFMSISEFGRTVHAEMAALIDAARRGVGVDKLTMYVTTFPCHNCAKHIIASGIKKVVYLEPYPKSRADFLHAEEIALDPVNENYAPRVGFVPFSGVAPRQYHQLFTMAVRGGKKGIPLKEWDSKRTTLLPRYVARNASKAYLAAERQELEELSEAAFNWDKESLLP
jgi:cytidine deaminase